MKNTKDKQLDVILCMAPPFAPSMPPIGIGYINSYLKSKGVKTDIYDINIELYNSLSSEKKSLWDFDISNRWGEIETANSVCKPAERERVVDAILAKNPLIVGFSVNSANKFFTQLLISSIRKRKIDVTIVVGGPGCYYQVDREFFPDGFVDAFVVGEGEISFHELFLAKQQDTDISLIEGVFVPGAPKKFKARPLIKDLDLLPYPDINDFSIEDYAAKALPVMFSRGCVNRCAFCSDHLVWDNTYRARNAESVVSEIENNSQKTGIKDVVFYDLTINGDLKKLEDFCDILVKKGADFNFTANICVRKDMTLDLFTKMKKSGFFALYFGVESGSDNILKAMKKNFTASTAHANLSNAKEAGILNYVNFIVGFPGEKEEDFNDTVDFLKASASNLEGVNNINACNLVANTYIFEHHKELDIKNHTSPDWFEAKNTLDSRTKKLQKLLDVAKENNKRIFNHGFIADEVKLPNMNISKPLCAEVCVVLAPYASVSIPNHHTAKILGLLSKTKTNFDLFDFNMNLYKNVSEKKRDFWQQHKVLKWSKKDTCKKIFADLNILELGGYFDKIKNTKCFVFPVTVFNLESVKMICEFIKRNYPPKEIFLVPDYKFSDFKNLETDTDISIFTKEKLFKHFDKNKEIELKNITPIYTAFSAVDYEDFILETDSFTALPKDVQAIKKQNSTLLFKSFNLDIVKIAKHCKCASYLAEDDILDESVLAKLSFVVIKISADVDIKKEVDKNICSLKKALQIIMWCKEKKIKVFLEILVGVPGETKEKFDELLEFVKENISLVDTVYRADKFIPDVNFLKRSTNCEIKISKEDAVPVLWTDKFGSNDHLRTVRLYFLTKELSANGKEPKYTNINYAYTDNESTDAIAEILSYKNKEVVDLNQEKKVLAAELNAVADKRVEAVVLEKDKAVEEIAKQNKDNFTRWEAKFIKEISKRDKEIKELFRTKDSLNNIIDGLEQENDMIRKSLGYRLEIFIKKCVKKVFFLKDR